MFFRRYVISQFENIKKNAKSRDSDDMDSIEH